MGRLRSKEAAREAIASASDVDAQSVPRLAVQRKQAAEALAIGVDTFDRYVRPELPVVYVGSVRLYPVAAIEQWLASRARITIGELNRTGRRRGNGPPPAQGDQASSAAQA